MATPYGRPGLVERGRVAGGGRLHIVYAHPHSHIRAYSHRYPYTYPHSHPYHCAYSHGYPHP